MLSTFSDNAGGLIQCALKYLLSNNLTFERQQVRLCTACVAYNFNTEHNYTLQYNYNYMRIKLGHVKCYQNHLYTVDRSNHWWDSQNYAKASCRTHFTT